MIKIDESLLERIDEKTKKSLIDKHLDWFVDYVSQKSCPNTWEGYKGKTLQDYLIDVLELDKTKKFKDEIRPYIVGKKDEIELLRKKKKKLNGIKSALTEEVKQTLTEEEITKIEREEKEKDKNANQLYDAFCYDVFSRQHSTEDKWDAYKFCEGLKIDVCPYCNRQYIFTVRKHQEGQHNGSKECVVRPEIDHYYPKKTYPYLSCNIYNFIPACPTCNHIKSDYNENDSKPSSLIYPYRESFGDNGFFRLKFNNVYIESEKLFKGFYDKENSNNDEKYEYIKICIESNDIIKKKVELSKKIFHLEDIYDLQRIELTDFLDKYRNYKDPKRREILKLFKESTSEKIDEKQLEIFLNIMSCKLEKQLLGLYETAKEYPLKKMKTDIKKQLDGESG